MSRVTNPEKESSVSCGFFNSISDRKYDAIQMSEIFDGVIEDGIFASIGTCFVVEPDEGNFVNVGIGKAWFNHTWTKNDAILPVECEMSEVLLDRIDAIVIEVDNTEAVRDNFIKVIKGTPSSEAVKPVMRNETDFHQHALCYITRKAGSAEITKADIENVIGTEETPFITGPLNVISVDKLLGQWQAQLDQFVQSETDDFSEWYQLMKDVLQEKANEMDTWTSNEKESYLEWLKSIKGKLDEDTAGNLQNQIDDSDVVRILMVGFADGNKTFSEDGTTITSTDSENRTLTKVFSEGFSVCTSTLADSHGVQLGKLVKTFSTDGKTITSELTIGQ